MFFYIVLALYLFFVFKKTKFFIPICIILICVYFSFKLNQWKIKELEAGEYEGVYEVIDVQTNYIVIKGQTKCIVFEKSTDLKPGDVIEAKIHLYKLNQASFEGDFNEKSYYASKGITNRGKILKYKYIKSIWRLERIRYYVLDFYSIHLGEKSFSYLKTLFFGLTELDKEVKEAYSLLYISHILAISGLHITFFFSFLVLILQKLCHIKGDIIAVSIIGIYVFFIGYPVSCLRAFLFLALRIWNKKGFIHYTELDILSVVFIGMVLFFPLKAFQTSFILSFVISFFLLFMKDFNLAKSKIKKAFLSSLICICSILPFLINQTNQISFIGILLSFLLGVILVKFLFPCIFALLFFPISFYEVIFDALDKGLIFISKYTYPISYPHLSIFWMIIYYVIFVYILICFAKGRRKLILVYIPIYLCLVFSLRIVNPFYKVTFIDVGQGDSILIELPHDQGNILVDSYYNTVEYLKSIGIRKLDYVILTHFDNDHMGTIEDVIKNFQVSSLLYSEFENVEKLSNLSIEKIPVKSGAKFKMSKAEFHILGPVNAYSDSNSNSVVLKFTFNNYSFLMTGDMTEKEEKDLILKYEKELRCDVLKVGHHGSETSTSTNFLKYVNPTYSIISVSDSNSYGLPSSEILRRLSIMSKIYMTKDSGNIQVIITDKIKIKEYR